MEKLISMVDFVSKLEAKIKNAQENNASFNYLLVLRRDCFESIFKYKNFLKQPLELWMFVPCDSDGNVLEEPKDDELCKYCSYDESKRVASAFSLGCEGSRCDSAADDFMDILEEAKDRVLFNNVEYVESKKEGDYSFFRIAELSQINYPKFWKNYTIEDLVKYNLVLTPTALKQIGYE